MLSYKVTTIDNIYTNNIMAGINTLKYKASKFKVIVCRLNDTIDISKYDKVAIIAHRKHNREYNLILNYYRRV